jgi:hypothetical protein
MVIGSVDDVTVIPLEFCTATFTAGGDHAADGSGGRLHSEGKLGWRRTGTGTGAAASAAREKKKRRDNHDRRVPPQCTVCHVDAPSDAES